MSKAEEYSFNIESELYNQLTPEQQKLWRKDIEDAWNNAHCEAVRNLALTLEGIKLIIDIVDSESLKPHLFDEIDYQEVLKRFNKERKEK